MYIYIYIVMCMCVIYTYGYICVYKIIYVTLFLGKSKAENHILFSCELS